MKRLLTLQVTLMPQTRVTASLKNLLLSMLTFIVINVISLSYLESIYVLIYSIAQKMSLTYCIAYETDMSITVSYAINTDNVVSVQFSISVQQILVSLVCYLIHSLKWVLPSCRKKMSTPPHSQTATNPSSISAEDGVDSSKKTPKSKSNKKPKSGEFFCGFQMLNWVSVNAWLYTKGL